MTTAVESRIPSSAGGDPEQPGKRSPLVADRLFTGSSQRRVHTQNLQEDIRMQQYATSIERAKKSIEHQHNFRKKAFIQKSERLKTAKDRLKRESLRVEELAREAEELEQLNRDNLMDMMDRLDAPYEEQVVDSRRLKGRLGTTHPQVNKSYTSRRLTRGTSRIVGMGAAELDDEDDDDYAESEEASWRASWDSDLNEDIVTPHKLRTRSTSRLGRGVSSSMPIPRPGLGKRVSKSNTVGTSSSITSFRKIADSHQMSNSFPAPLSGRSSVTSFASTGGGTPSRSESKQGFSMGDVPVPAGISWKSSQRQLNIGDMKKLTHRMSVKKLDYITDPDLRMEEEDELHELLRKSQAGNSENTNNITMPRTRHTPSMSLMNMEGGAKNAPGAEVADEIQSEAQAVGVETAGMPPSQTDALLQQLRLIPMTLPAIYLTCTRSSMVRPRNFEKEAKERKNALPVYKQFDNLRYCRYLRMPKDFYRDGNEELEEVKPERTPRVERTVTAQPRMLKTHPSVISLRHLQMALEGEESGDEGEEKKEKKVWPGDEGDDDEERGERGLSKARPMISRRSTLRTFGTRRSTRLLTPFSVTESAADELEI